jgi:GNAT superfamily N-acetyltransferase
MTVTLRELTEANRTEVLAIRLAPGQDRFVSSVAESLEEAEAYPQASPWYRAVYVGEQPVGFVMLSWDCVPQPPEIWGPWFLWKLLIDERYQHHGYGREVLRQIVDLVRAEGGDALLTSHVQGVEGNPGPFYERLGFVPTGEFDDDGEIVLSLDLRNLPRADR